MRVAENWQLIEERRQMESALSISSIRGFLGAVPKGSSEEESDDEVDETPFLAKAKSGFAEAAESASSLLTKLNSLSKEDVGCFLNITVVRRAIAEIRSALKDGVPVDKCPKCSGSRCPLCKESGFVNAARKGEHDEG